MNQVDKTMKTIYRDFFLTDKKKLSQKMRETTMETIKKFGNFLVLLKTRFDG